MSYFELMSLIDGDLNMEVKFGTDILYDLKDCWAVFSKLQLQGLRFLFAFSGSDVTASFYMKKKLLIFKLFMGLEPGCTVQQAFARLSNLSKSKRRTFLQFRHLCLSYTVVKLRLQALPMLDVLISSPGTPKT